MKIFLVCSKRFYDRVAPIAAQLEEAGHVVALPNSYDDPHIEARYRALGDAKHGAWKAGMIAHSAKVIQENDAVLMLNFDKDGQKNYLGGATFLEMYDAFKLGKTVFLYNDVPQGILHDEILGFAPLVLQGNLRRIR